MRTDMSSRRLAAGWSTEAGPSMFKRRTKHGILIRLRGFVWPHIGWRRAGAYFYYRLMRLKGSPHAIATGFACGAAVSFTPFIGLHFVFSAALAWLARGNVLAALLGTAVGNPWTFPFIWLGIYRVGCAIMGCDAGDGLPESLDIFVVMENPMKVLLPMFLGSIPVGAVAWLVVYWPVRRLVVKYKELRERRRARRLKRKKARERLERRREHDSAEIELGSGV